MQEKVMENLNKQVVYSAQPTYRRRSGFPSQGMWLADAGDILKKQGTTTEILDPSQLMNETQMNADVSCETPNKVGAYIFVNPHDIDAIASVIQQFNHCVLTFNSTHKEWQDVPVIDPATTTMWGHCVCAIDFTLHNGVKAL